METQVAVVWYNDRDQIEERIRPSGLEGLREVIEERYEAGRVREEELKEFMIMGNWWADRFGQWWRLLWEDGRPDLDFPTVASMEEWGDFCKLNAIEGWASTIGYPPSVNLSCDVCEKHWTIEDAHLAIEKRSVGEDTKYRHPICQLIFLEKEARESFESAFIEAGYKAVSLTSIPNEYCPKGPHCCGPWFKVLTPIGEFKIGWRKRVINLEWFEMPVDTSIFESESVTKWESGIHAWSKEKLVEYLERIRQDIENS